MKLAYYNGFTDSVSRCGATDTRRFMEENGLSLGEMFDVCVPGNIEGRTPRGGYAQSALITTETLLSEPIELACYSVGADFMRYGIEGTERELLLHAERAARLGSPVFHHTSVMGLDRAGLTEEPRAIIDRLLEPIARVARRVCELGMIPVYEPQGLVFNGCESFGYFMRKINTDMGIKGARVCMDFGNTRFLDTAPVEFLKEYLPLTAHVHLKDYRIMSVEEAKGADGEYKGYRSFNGAAIVGVPFFEGDSALREGIAMLLEGGYGGAFAIESDMRGSGGRPRIADDARRVREIFKNL